MENPNTTTREKIIEDYVTAYNQFDTEKMIADFAKDITFENVQNGQSNLILKGLQAFRQQAELVKTYFATRQQKIKSITHAGNKTEVEIEYSAVLAKDFPNGFKTGQELNLTGRSVFEFSDNKVIKLTDIS